MRVDWGSTVWMDYEAFLDSGKQIDTSEASGPLRIQVGGWHDVLSWGEVLLGLRESDERLIRREPPDGFGTWDPALVVTIPRSLLMDDPSLEDGALVVVEGARGRDCVCRLYRFEDGSVALDFNHPFAGEPVTLFVRVRRVMAPPREAVSESGAAARAPSTSLGDRGVQVDAAAKFRNDLTGIRRRRRGER